MEDQLEPMVDVGAPRRRRMERTVVVGTVMALGLGGVAAALAIHAHPGGQRGSVIVTMVPVAIERAAPASPAVAPEPPSPSAPVAPPAPASLEACGATAGGPERVIGTAVHVDDIARPWDLDREDLVEDETLRVVASPSTPSLAILHRGEVEVSTDEGQTFHRAFRGHEIGDVAIDRHGVVYALADGEIGVREPGGRTSWHHPPATACPREPCADRIAVVGRELYRLHGETIAASRDQGRTWRTVTSDDHPWSDERGSLFAWRGELYQVEHYEDMCGVDDSPVWRLSRQGTISNAIFHDEYPPTGPMLQPSDDAGTRWTWRERCPTDDDPPRLRACTEHDADASAMLRAKTLRPVEGGRTLAVFGGALVELCGDDASLVYRNFPFPWISAVDAGGHPLIAFDHAVYRWSTRYGWRRLWHAAPDESPAE